MIAVAAPVIAATSALENLTGDGRSGASSVFGDVNALSWTAAAAVLIVRMLVRHVVVGGRRQIARDMWCKYPNGPDTRFPRKVIWLGVLGLSLLVAAFFVPAGSVAAIPTQATATAALTKLDCSNDKMLPISYIASGQARSAQLQGQPCDHEYQPGDTLTVYVDSRDPLDVGPTAEWILDPSTHNPFEFVGPNDLQSFAFVLASALLITAAGLAFASWKRRIAYGG